MNWPQLAMLALETAFMACVLLGLFRVRTVLGLTPLYIVLGGLQYLEATLSLRVEVAPGYALYPASTVLFTATLVPVLLVYMKEDAIEARKLVYGLVLANAVAAAVSLLIGWHLALPGTAPTNLRPHDFLGSAWISAVGTSLLFLDVLGIILLYEFICRYVRGIFMPFYLAMLVVVFVDNLVFTVLVHATRPDVVALIATGFVGKAVAALFYSGAAWIYLKYFEPRVATVGAGDVADVFHRLTYRQKYEEARQRMVRDALTGLFNRGYFDEAVPRAFAHAQQTGEPVSLLIMDVDKFKDINDTLSHMEGDRALQVIAQTLTERSRASDVPCRYGGDEFVILLTQADATTAAHFAERFREALFERCQQAVPPFPWGVVSTTVGIATYPGDSEIVSPADLVRVADRRLYEGKQGGRDRVISMAVK